MNRERVRELMADVDELVAEVHERLEEIRQELEVPDDPPPASIKKGPGSRLVPAETPPVDEFNRARGRRAVRRITGAPSLVGRKGR